MLKGFLFQHMDHHLALTVYILTIFIVMFLCFWLYSVCRQNYESMHAATEDRIKFQIPRAPILTSLPSDYKYGQLLYDTTYAESDLMEQQTLRKLIGLVNPFRDPTQDIEMNPKSIIGSNVMLKMEGDMWRYTRVLHLIMGGSYIDKNNFEVHMESETEV